ncbi:hypothetical protein BH23CHL4_BH23CHL4_18120 [soil metagenome]
MSVSRRSFLGGVAVAGAVSMTSQMMTVAQEGTPTAVESGTPAAVDMDAPCYAIVRVWKLPTAELNHAILPHVMHAFLPIIETVPGHAGYVFAIDDADPTASITLTLVADEAVATASDEAAQGFVDGLDPRFVTETPVAERGPLRIYEMTSRPASELPPFLNGCYLTVRNRVNAPDADIESVIAMATQGLVPTLAAMDGFVLYGWIQIENGRVAINIWETMEQLEAGNEAVAAYVAENTASTTTGDPVVNTGMIGYAEIAGIA